MDEINNAKIDMINELYVPNAKLAYTEGDQGQQDSLGDDKESAKFAARSHRERRQAKGEENQKSKLHQSFQKVNAFHSFVIDQNYKSPMEHEVNYILDLNKYTGHLNISSQAKDQMNR